MYTGACPPYFKGREPVRRGAWNFKRDWLRAVQGTGVADDSGYNGQNGVEGHTRSFLPWSRARAGTKPPTTVKSPGRARSQRWRSDVHQRGQPGHHGRERPPVGRPRGRPMGRACPGGRIHVDVRPAGRPAAKATGGNMGRWTGGGGKATRSSYPVNPVGRGRPGEGTYSSVGRQTKRGLTPSVTAGRNDKPPASATTTDRRPRGAYRRAAG